MFFQIVSLHNWTSWEDDEVPSSIKVVDNASISHDSSERSNQNYQSVGRMYNRQPSNEPELEIDYFQDMVPEIKKSKKVSCTMEFIMNEMSNH